MCDVSKDVSAYVEDLQYIAETLEYIDEMELVLDNPKVCNTLFEFTILDDEALHYQIYTSQAFKLYIAIRALWKQFNEGTEDEDEALKSAVFDVLYKYLVCDD